MSMDPQMIAQLLMQRGQQGGTAPGGQNYSPNGVGQAANLLQQVLMAQQLKQRFGQQPPQQPPPPQPNMLGGVNAQPQAMQAQQLAGVNA